MKYLYKGEELTGKELGKKKHSEGRARGKKPGTPEEKAYWKAFALRKRDAAQRAKRQRKLNKIR